jgi:hypothetical protein
MQRKQLKRGWLFRHCRDGKVVKLTNYRENWTRLQFRDAAGSRAVQWMPVESFLREFEPIN